MQGESGTGGSISKPELRSGCIMVSPSLTKSKFLKLILKINKLLKILKNNLDPDSAAFKYVSNKLCCKTQTNVFLF